MIALVVLGAVASMPTVQDRAPTVILTGPQGGLARVANFRSKFDCRDNDFVEIELAMTEENKPKLINMRYFEAANEEDLAIIEDALAPMVRFSSVSVRCYSNHDATIMFLGTALDDNGSGAGWSMSVNWTKNVNSGRPYVNWTRLNSQDPNVR